MKNDSNLKQFSFSTSLYALLFFYHIISWSVTLTMFWLWFIVPVFDMNAITYFEAIGVVTFSTLVFRSNIILQLLFITDPEKPKPNNNDNIKIFFIFTNPWLILLFGYIVRLVLNTV